MEISSITFQDLLTSMPVVLGMSPFPKCLSKVKHRVLKLKLWEVNEAENKKNITSKEVQCESCRKVDKAQTPEKPECWHTGASG